MYCTCGQSLISSESTRKSNKRSPDAISIADNVIKKCATHGARHGKTEVQGEYRVTWNAWKRCCKKVDSQGEHLQIFTIDFSGIQSIVNHNSQSDGRNKRAESGMNLQKKTTTPVERRICKGYWFLTMKKTGKNWHLKLRSYHFSSTRVDQPTGWEYWPSSTSSSWW